VRSRKPEPSRCIQLIGAIGLDSRVCPAPLPKVLKTIYNVIESAPDKTALDFVQLQVEDDHMALSWGRPFLQPVAQLLDIELPTVCERHVKLTFSDRQAVIPCDAPLRSTLA